MRAQAFPRMSLQICKKSVEIILALQSRASLPRAMRECHTLFSWQAQHFTRFACCCNVISRDRRSTLRALRADFVAGAALSWVESLLQLRGAHLEIAK